jgi:hypothetical protein
MTRAISGQGECLRGKAYVWDMCRTSGAGYPYTPATQRLTRWANL